MNRLRMQVCGVLMVTVLSACQSDLQLEERINLEFVVISEDCLPEELLVLIEEEKEEPFKMTYTDGNYLYICRGYGEKPTGGYSIVVPELYQTTNAIYLKTDLIGPSKEEQKNQVSSYPYIVVRISDSEESVVFDS